MISTGGFCSYQVELEACLSRVYVGFPVSKVIYAILGLSCIFFSNLVFFGS